MTAVGDATIGCRICAAETQLDETNIVRCAQIAAFVAAHRHTAGFAVSLTLAANAESESSRPIVLDPFALTDQFGSTTR